MIVCVTGGKGGPGATATAVGLAAAMARCGVGDVLLLDLDPCGGDIAVYLEPENLDPRRGLLPLLRLGQSIEPDAIAREAQDAGVGLSVVLGLLRPEMALTGSRVRALLTGANRLAEVVIADIGRLMPDHPALHAPEPVDRWLLVARPDLQGALAAGRALALLDSTGELSVMASRVRRSADVVELSEALGRDVMHSVPEVRVGRSRGLLQVRRFRKAMDRLACLLLSEGTKRVPETAGMEVVAS